MWEPASWRLRGRPTLVKRSQDKAKAAGAQFVFGQAGVRLVHNEDGTEVTGLIAMTPTPVSTTSTMATPWCGLCGDIGSNSAMYNAICRENYELGECQGLRGHVRSRR